MSRTYPKIDAVLSQGGAMSQAAIDAFKGAGRKLVPMSGEAINGYLRAWKENGIKSVAFTSPTYMSADALVLAVRALNGEKLPKEVPLTTPTVTDENLKACPEILAGAGTVTRTEQIDAAIEAGAEFIVTPGFDAELVAYAQSKNISRLAWDSRLKAMTRTLRN